MEDNYAFIFHRIILVNWKPRKIALKFLSLIQVCKLVFQLYFLLVAILLIYYSNQMRPIKC